MRKLCRGSAVSDIVRLSVCVTALGVAAAVGGCAGSPGERVYGYQTSIPGGWADLIAGGTSRMSSAQEEAIIAQAIVAHEMRRP